MKLAHLGIGATILVGAAAVPVIPQDLQLKYSYEMTCQEALHPDPIPKGKEFMYDPQYIPASCTGDNIYVSVFKDDLGAFAFKEITKEEYQAMSQKEGQQFNPKNTELKSLMQLGAEAAHAAIAFDNSGINTFPGGTVASITFSYSVVSNTNGILTAFSFQDQSSQSDNSTTATYNGTNAPKITGQTGSGAGFTGGMGSFYQLTPSTGAHNMVINFSPNTRAAMALASYTGASQTGQPDNSASGAPTTATLTASVTVNSANSWLVMGAIDDTGATVTAGVGTTLRQAGGSGHNLADSNAGVSTGSQSLQLIDLTNRWTYIILSISPPVTATPANPYPILFQ